MKSPRSQRIVQNGLPDCVLPRSPRPGSPDRTHGPGRSPQPRIFMLRPAVVTDDHVRALAIAGGSEREQEPCKRARGCRWRGNRLRASSDYRAGCRVYGSPRTINRPLVVLSNCERAVSRIGGQDACIREVASAHPARPRRSPWTRCGSASAARRAIGSASREQRSCLQVWVLAALSLLVRSGTQVWKARFEFSWALRGHPCASSRLMRPPHRRRRRGTTRRPRSPGGCAGRAP
jgi:hypothetical protein